MPRPLDSSIDLLLRTIDEAFDRRSWHGTNLRGSIRGLTIDEAAWRPAPRRRNIWEIVVHAAYWKYTVRRRLLRERRGSFPLPGSNWFVRPGQARGRDALWDADVALLVSTHRSLREGVAELSPRDLARHADGGKVTIGWLVTGIVAHDLYHAGQIQLLKRLQSS